MSEPSSGYQDGEVVWVKWGNVWWPGEVYSSSRVPEDMTSSLRKPVIAFVKFLQEDSFELVRSNNNISKYNCDKKLENIKKGIDKYKTNKTMKENFSACITKAEQMTGGNVNILKSLETPTKSKSVPSSTPDPVKKLVPQTSTPTSSAKKAAITPSSYNSSVKVQNTTSVEQNKPNEKRLSCTMCPFTTDRMNLLMMHIKGHSLEIQSRVSSGSINESRRPVIPKSTAARKLEVDDGIADDVRKIKESMKEKSFPSPVSAGRKSKTATPKVEKATPKTAKTRALKRGVKNVKEKSPKITQQEVAPDEEEKPKVNEELKKELLADWLDDDDVVAPEKEKIETPKAPIVDEKPKQHIEKVLSVPIRNIPKKQRVSEMYIQPESSTAPAVHEDDTNVEEKSPFESSRKSQTSQRKRKLNAEKPEVPQKPDDDGNKMDIDEEDEKLLMATTELLNEIEVPTKSSNVEENLDARAQSPSTTFQKSNDIDKRNLPPKERNKRIFRARNKSPEIVETVASAPPLTPSHIELNPIVQNDEQTTIESVKVVSVNKNDRQELMLPHKKKQSSRLLQPTVTEAIKNQPALEVVGGRKKKRKSSADLVIGSEESQAPIVDILPQSPLRESQHECDDSTIDTEIITHNRGQKRHLSSEKALESEEPETKKFHKSSEPRTITCGANEAICITSKGTLAVARRDSLKTTQANSVVVTSQVIISEPIASPEVVTTASKSSSVVSLPQHAVKNALKIPKENMEDFKKQGLLTVENNRSKLTPKGLQIFKEFQRDEKIVSNNNVVQTSSSSTSVLSNLSSATEDAPESAGQENNSQRGEESSQIDISEPMDVSDSNKEDVKDSLTKSDELNVDSTLESDQNGSQEITTVKQEEQENAMELDESPKEIKEVVDVEVDSVMPKKGEEDEPNELNKPKDEPLKSVEMKKEEIIEEKNQVEPEDFTEMSTKKEQEEEEEVEVKKPLENGSKEIKDDDLDDANTSSGAGLIALQAENFGGPPNCFYLCRQIDDRYEPVDNQILVLNAQNALVPYEGEVALTPGVDHSLVAENLSAYSQLSPNSNIIINTPNGQKVELNYFAIMALQESADENGIASMEYAGEQFELNINAILEAIAAQPDNESTDGVSLIDGTVDANTLILTESTDLPVEIKHSATQVSETLLSKPIMSTTVAPEIATINPVMSTIAEKNLNIDDSLAAIGVTQTSSRANVPKSLELPITVTNPTIAETVNHRKLATATTVISNSEAVSDSLVVQTTDNGSDD